MTQPPASPAVPLPQSHGLEFRPLRHGDVDEWLALVKRIAAFEDAPWHLQRSDLESAFTDLVNPVADNTAAGVDADGVLRAFGWVEKNPDGDKAILEGGVDPLWRRRGVGAAVLAWQEARAKARFAVDNAASDDALAENAGAAKPPAAKVRNHVEEDNPGQQELLARAGYAVVRYYSQMRRALAEIPAVAVPEGIRIVPVTAELGNAVRLAHNEAFADHWGSEPRTPERWALLMSHEHSRLDLSTAAVDTATGDVVGYQMTSVDPDEVRDGISGEGYTELLGVRRAWRGRGLAPALLADAMARYTAAGLNRAALDVDTENPTGALGLYERMGYVPVRRSMVWDKLL